MTYENKALFEFTRANGLKEKKLVPVEYGEKEIDGKTVATTTIGTSLTDADKYFYPMIVQFILMTVADLTTPATVSIGTNDSDYDNLLGNTDLTGLLTTQGNFVTIPVGASAQIPRVSPSTPIKMKVQTGATATTYELQVNIIGFYGL